MEGHAGAGREDRHGHPPVCAEEGIKIRISDFVADAFFFSGLALSGSHSFASSPKAVSYTHLIFAEGNQIVQPAVHEDVRHMDLGVQEIECGKIKYEIQRHEAKRMARKPTAFH